MGYPNPNPNPNGEKKNALVRTGLAIDPRPFPVDPLYIELIDDLLLRPPPNPELPLRIPYPDEKDDPRMPPMRPPLLADDAGLANAKFSNSAPTTIPKMRLKGNCPKTVLIRAPNVVDDGHVDVDDDVDDDGDVDEEVMGVNWNEEWDEDWNEEAARTHRVGAPCTP